MELEQVQGRQPARQLRQIFSTDLHEEQDDAQSVARITTLHRRQA